MHVCIYIETSFTCTYTTGYKFPRHSTFNTYNSSSSAMFSSDFHHFFPHTKMHSLTLICPLKSNPMHIQINPRKNNAPKKNPQPFMSGNWIFPDKSRLRNANPKNFCVSCLTSNESPVSQKVQALNLEFKSLSEPIDRVKRLLQYANHLPQFDESAKIQENRVMGCTAQVWLDVKMDKNGLMRFRVDSDSEITKGFCSCLIWLLDCSKPEEVSSVKTDDLVEMNVGLPSRGRSRVNTWHNVLISMQKRTKNLVEERKKEESL